MMHKEKRMQAQVDQGYLHPTHMPQSLEQYQKTPYRRGYRIEHRTHSVYLSILQRVHQAHRRPLLQIVLSQQIDNARQNSSK